MIDIHSHIIPGIDDGAEDIVDTVEMVRMAEKKRRITLTDFEHRVLINALVDYRNMLLESNKPTEDVNELLLNVIDAPKHKWWR